MKNIFFAFVAFLGLLLVIFEGAIIYSSMSEEGTERPAKESPAAEASAEEELIVPESVNLNVPFIAQAPGGDWSYPFPYTCEEAAALMVHYFFEGRDEADVAKTKLELLALVDFEEKNYGFHKDTSVAHTARLIRDYYGYDARVSYDISLDDIKGELALGRPVLVPVAGQLLENPNFTPPGPAYHLVLLKGYNKDGFISHDPGTAKGADFPYSYQIMEEAIHDLTEGDIMEGRRAMISFSEN